MREYPLEVLRDADRAFRGQAHRGDLRDPARYFAAIVRNVNEEHRRTRARNRREASERNERKRRDAAIAAQHRAWDADPVSWLRHGLDAIGAYWQPDRRRLLCGGIGPGSGATAGAIERLVEVHGAPAARDIAEGVFQGFATARSRILGEEGVAAVRSVLRSKLCQHAASPAASPPDILAAAGFHRRSPPAVRLRI